MVLIALMSVAILAVLALTVREILLFRRQQQPYPLRRLVLRLSTSAMLLFLLAAIAVGVLAYHLDRIGGEAFLFLAFWTAVAVLAGGIFCLVMADFRLINDDARQEAKRIWREIAETLAANGRETPKD